jgi:hypothetical protein
MTDPTTSTSPFAVDPAATPDEQPKFELFPKLPPELRLKIWNIAPESRVVEVLFKQDHRKNNYKFLATIPEILHTNHEARVEGLRRYKHVFKTKWALNGVFFDFETDILYFSRAAGDSQKNLFLRKVKPAELAKVQNFAAAGWDICQAGSFPGMKKMIFLCPHQIESTPTMPTMENHKCEVAGGDVEFHEMEDLIARYPEQPHLTAALSTGKMYYARMRSRCRHWQDPNGCILVYAVSCDKALQRPCYVL